MKIGSMPPAERQILIEGLNKAIDRQKEAEKKANEELKKSEEGQS